MSIKRKKEDGIDSLVAKREKDKRERERIRRELRSKRTNNTDGKTTSTNNNGDEQVQIEEDKRTNEEILDNTIKEAVATTHTGRNTLQQLQTQREQLEKVDRDLNAMNQHLTRTDRILNGMKSFGGAISNLFTKQKKSEVDSLYE